MHIHIDRSGTTCWFLKIQIRFAAEDFGPVNFKNSIKLFLRSYGTCILIKLIKNKNTSIRLRRFFWQVGLTTQDLFPTIFQAVPLHYRVRVGVQIDKGSLELLMFSTHEIKRVGWRQKG